MAAQFSTVDLCRRTHDDQYMTNTEPMTRPPTRSKEVDDLLGTMQCWAISTDEEHNVIVQGNRSYIEAEQLVRYLKEPLDRPTFLQTRRQRWVQAVRRLMTDLDEPF